MLHHVLKAAEFGQLDALVLGYQLHLGLPHATFPRLSLPPSDREGCVGGDYLRLAAQDDAPSAITLIDALTG